MRDPYEVLGVKRQADAAAIKAAWRRLAKQFHPDRAPGDTAIADKFHEISAAYDFLRDEKRRHRYDAGEIDASGRRRRFGNWETDEETAGPGHEAWKAGFARNGGSRPNGRTAGANGDGTEDLHFRFTSSEREEAFRSQSIFSDLFGNLRGAPKMRKRGPDVTYRLSVSFEEAACGATRRVRLPSGKRLEVCLPAGSDNGHQIRLKGEGEPGTRGGVHGDALIVVDVKPHKTFRRSGSDIHIDQDVSLRDAVLGAKITVPTIHGPVAMTVPPGSNTGTVLRLRGKGITPASACGLAAGPAGDHLVTLRVVLPGADDTEFAELVRRWASRRNGA